MSDVPADLTELLDELRHREAAERAAREELSAILEGVVDAVVAQQDGGRIVYANRAAIEMLGYEDLEGLQRAPLAELRARFVFEHPDGRPMEVSELPGRVALRGGHPEDLVVRYVPADDRRRRWCRLKARPLHDGDGSVRLAITVVEDITELKRAELSQRFLAEASRVLAGSLDYEHTLTRVAELAVPGIADWCVIDLATADGFERVTVHHADPERRAFADDLARRYPPDPQAPTGVPEVLRTGRSECYPVIPEGLLEATAVDAEHLALIRSVGMVSAMIVPMRLRDEVLGAITFVTAESAREFDSGDLALAEDLGMRAATAVQNARLYAERSAIAHTLQASLLPPELPAVPGMEAAAVFRAAGDAFEVGGDFYDLFSTAEDEWFAVVGDVCGKGADAAATTALVRYTVRAAAVQRRAPGEILRWLNEAMLRQGAAPGRFCTLVVARLDLRPGAVTVTAACGGHPLPQVVRAGGTVEPVGVPGTLIGVVDRVSVPEASAALEPGDSLVLYTDGLIEAQAPLRVWSPEDLAAALREAHAGAGGSVDRMVEQLTGAAVGDLSGDPRDDVAVLALRRA